MIINGLAEGLPTAPEWLTGLFCDNEYSVCTVCRMDPGKHSKGYPEAVTNTVNERPHQAVFDHLPRSDREPLHLPHQVLDGVHEEGR